MPSKDPTILIVPGLDLVLVRLGRTPAALAIGLQSWLADVVASFRRA